MYKQSPGNNATVLRPADIESFGIGKEMVFEKYTFKDKNGNELTGFFKVLVRGKLTLLTSGKRYFVLTDKKELHEISQQVEEASGAMKENRAGFGALKVLMKDCPKTDEGYLTREYSDTHLKDIFVVYNECVGATKFVSNDIKAKTYVDFGIQLLPSLARMNEGLPMNNSDMSSSKTLAGGAYLSAFLPGSFQKMRVLLELNYYQYTGYGFYHYQNYNTGTNTTTLINNDVFVKYTALQVPLLIRYGNRFFADIGLQNHLNISTTAKWRTETITPGYVTTSYDYPAILPKVLSTGVLIGGGAKFEVGLLPVRVFARYGRSGSNLFSGKPGYQIMSIGLSVQLTKSQK
ncbi:MAG: hypothetical protein WDO14_20660 [Bacteroidota bacterium]